jgi:hypothetical protein
MGAHARPADLTRPAAKVLRRGGPRVLPIRLAPLPGEAFDSWLEAYAARFQAPLGDLVDALGLACPSTVSHHGEPSPNWTTALRPAEVDRVVQATGVHATHVTDLTMQRYDGVAVVVDSDTLRVRRTQLMGAR